MLSFTALLTNLFVDAVAQSGNIIVHDKYDFTISVHYDLTIGEESLCFLVQNNDMQVNLVEASNPTPMQWYRYDNSPEVYPWVGHMFMGVLPDESGPNFRIERIEPFSSISDTLILSDESLPIADRISIVVRYVGFRCSAVRSDQETERISFKEIGRGGEYLGVDSDSIIVIESKPFEINMHVNSPIKD